MQIILFLCPHNAAKSVIAAAYFNDMAREAELTYVGDSAGTEPSDTVSPIVAQMLNREGIDVSSYQPRLVTPEELRTAARIISIGCKPQELGTAEHVEYWDDVPMVSQNPEGACEAIRTHVNGLVRELKAEL